MVEEVGRAAGVVGLVSGAVPVAEVVGLVEGKGYVAGVVAVVGRAAGVIAVVGGVVRAAGAVPWLGELPHPSAPSAPSYSARYCAYRSVYTARAASSG